MKRLLTLGAVLVLSTSTCAVIAAAQAQAQPVTASSLAFGACPTDVSTPYPSLTCATLNVPLDFTKPLDKAIPLTVAKLPARDPARRRGVLMVNSGGPGSSTVNYIGKLTKPSATGTTRLPASVLDSYDIIGMDPRGVVHSSAIHCTDPAFWAGPMPDADTVDGRAQWWQVTSNYAAACAMNTADMLPFMGTENVAWDLEGLRQALGETKISYLGYSYGTYLGAVYATLFPQQVDRMILDGNLDPTPVDMFYRAGLAQNVPLNARREQWFDWVARYDNVFHLGTSTAQVQSAFDSTMADLRRAPHGRVGPSELIDLTWGSMYAESNWTGLAQAIADFALRKDDRALIAQAQPTPSANSENHTAVFNAVTCVDSPAPRDPRVWERDAAEVARDAPFATWWNQLSSGECANWSVPPHNRILPTGQDLPPILMFNSIGDPATPYAGALRMHSVLPTSVLVTERDSGKHCVFASPLVETNTAANQIGADYLVNGVLPAQDISVPGHPLPVPPGA